MISRCSTGAATLVAPAKLHRSAGRPADAEALLAALAR
jgi:hypothetical protein